MTRQMHTLSARIPAEDFEWLSALAMPAAATPSDKLRGLIGQMRKQHEGALDYTACVAWLRELLAPLAASIKGLEHRNHMHSAAVATVLEWAPQVMATLLAARDLRNEDAAAAIALEKALVQQSFQLLTAMLRLAITPKSECYTEDALEKSIPRVLELADFRKANRESKENVR